MPGVSPLDRETDWRDPFLRNLLQEHKIPYIWTKEVFKKDITKQGKNISFERYIMPDNGHPTSYFNQLIAREIKTYIYANFY
jgi:hypothetical protein